MSRMNSRKRKKYFQLIVERDGGAFCYIGGEPLIFESAVIDHWNNRNDDNRLLNLNLLCRSMNSVKNGRGRDKRHQMLSPVSGNIYTQMVENEGVRTNSIEIIRNMVSEPNFKHWLFWKIVHDEKVMFEDALDAGAAFARCSQETVRRYLKKEVSEARLYTIIEDTEMKKKIVVLKSEFKTFRDKGEEKKKMNRVVQNWKEIMNEEAFTELRGMKKEEKKEPLQS